MALIFLLVIIALLVYFLVFAPKRAKREDGMFFIEYISNQTYLFNYFNLISIFRPRRSRLRAEEGQEEIDQILGLGRRQERQEGEAQEVQEGEEEEGREQVRERQRFRLGVRSAEAQRLGARSVDKDAVFGIVRINELR